MNYSNIRKSHWLYNVLHPLVHTEYRLLFRKIYLHHAASVPANKPVLIASNHPTAFIDPMFLCIFFDPPVYNMTRGDIFRKPFFRKLLESLNMFPVFRQRDGYGQRDRNDEVFEFCKQKLKEGVAVNIFVEGEHHLDKRVFPLQKGIARIAFGAYESLQLDDLQIVPVGCNYLNGASVRDEAKIIVGEPLFIRDYWQGYQQNSAAAINQLCLDIRNALKQLCYHIEDPADDALTDQLLELFRNSHPTPMLPVVYRHGKRFFREKELIKRVNEMQEPEKDELKRAVDGYFNELNVNNLTDEALARPGQGGSLWWLLFITGFIPWLITAVFRWPSAAFGNYLARTKVRKPEFRTSIMVGGSLLVNLVAILTLVLVGVFTGKPVVIALGMLWPLLLWFAVFFGERWVCWVAARKALRHPQRNSLLAQRKDIGERILSGL